MALEKMRKINEHVAKPDDATVNIPPTGEIFLPNDLEELKSKSTKKSQKGLTVASNWKKEESHGDAEFDDLIDVELLKEKRKEELMAYETMLFGESPHMYTVDPNNPKPFLGYDLEGNISNEFGKLSET
jgi:hypothetical protein